MTILAQFLANFGQNWLCCRPGGLYLPARCSHRLRGLAVWVILRDANPNKWAVTVGLGDLGNGFEPRGLRYSPILVRGCCTADGQNTAFLYKFGPCWGHCMDVSQS